uniref:Uncharacterized protein n=1 Tax=Setaria viridis TaxID=4556 RepID=A0A4U6U296_SETVI|nr:hypothetical protein SEVIR_6G117366v2 [Setaria viridis]
MIRQKWCGSVLSSFLVLLTSCDAVHFWSCTHVWVFVIFCLLDTL